MSTPGARYGCSTTITGRQRNYYERVLRTDRDLERAREYIADNPRRWLEDPNHPRNKGVSLRRGVGASHSNG